MQKIEKDARVSAIRNYVQGIGLELSNTQAHEVLARALGLKNKHVLAAQTVKSSAAARAQSSRTRAPSVEAGGPGVPVQALDDKPFDVERMQQLDWTFDVIVPVPLDFVGDIQRFNDHVSARITGNDAALEDISFEHAPEVVYGNGFVAYRVHGYVSCPADFFDEVADQEEASFYDGLRELAVRLQQHSQLTVLEPGVPAVFRIEELNESRLQLILQYANSLGASNDDVNEVGDQPVVCLREASNSWLSAPLVLSVDSLKYATRQDARTWSVTVGQTPYRLAF